MDARPYRFNPPLKYLAKLKNEDIGAVPVCAFKIGIALFVVYFVTVALCILLNQRATHIHSASAITVLSFAESVIGIDHFKFVDQKVQVVSIVKLYLR